VFVYAWGKYFEKQLNSCFQVILSGFHKILPQCVPQESLWQDFVKAAENSDAEDGRAAMYQAISELPQPNRDTLAFIMHLQM
jgi:Rac GTPase-activating protein 1